MWDRDQLFVRFKLKSHVWGKKTILSVFFAKTTLRFSSAKWNRVIKTVICNHKTSWVPHLPSVFVQWRVEPDKLLVITILRATPNHNLNLRKANKRIGWTILTPVKCQRLLYYDFWISSSNEPQIQYILWFTTYHNIFYGPDNVIDICIPMILY